MSSVEEKQFIEMSLDALCFRPKESILMDRGNVQRETYRFDVPASFVLDEYMESSYQPAPLSDTTQVLYIQDVPKKLGLDFVGLLGRDETFSIYIPKHQRVASRLLVFLQEIKNPRDLVNYLVYLHDRCNPYLFNYVLALLVLNGVANVQFTMPDYFQLFPELFINGGSYNKGLASLSVEPTEVRTPFVIEDQFTGTKGDQEQLLYYFREDISLNLFHVIFNRIYPCDGPAEFVLRPKRGEIFYHVYQQLIARYNFERLSNGLVRVKRLNNFFEPIPEVCFPKLNSKTTRSNWPGRMRNLTMSDLDRDREELVCDVSGLERWRDRILEAIDQGYVIMSDGSKFPITDEGGIDCLGSAIHSSVTSPNQRYYGNLCRMGLVFLGFIHDPTYKHKESFGVIADSSTTLRDPVAYRWFALIVDILQSFKKTLPKYTPSELGFPGVEMRALGVSTEFSTNVYKSNEFYTFYNYRDVDLSAGIDYAPRETLRAKARQLTHKPFSYQLNIINSAAQATSATIRIFLLPKEDERGENLNVTEQRELAIEMDKFPVTLTPGENSVTRRSEDAMITKWFSSECDYFKRTIQNPRPENLNVFGWPKNLLVPKGNTRGFPCQLFAMVTPNTASGFSDDSKPLGYPFDRPNQDAFTRLSLLCADYRNMMVVDTKITFLLNETTT